MTVRSSLVWECRDRGAGWGCEQGWTWETIEIGKEGKGRKEEGDERDKLMGFVRGCCGRSEMGNARRGTCAKQMPRLVYQPTDCQNERVLMPDQRDRTRIRGDPEAETGTKWEGSGMLLGSSAFNRTCGELMSWPCALALPLERSQRLHITTCTTPHNQ